jgi:hypothetical protein
VEKALFVISLGIYMECHTGFYTKHNRKLDTKR